MANIHINFTKFDSLIQIADFFSSEEICKAAIAQERWGDGAAVCPYCGSTHTHVCKDGRYICKGCQRKFSVTVGTIFENTKISLRKWFMAMYLISSHKKGVSSCQLAREKCTLVVGKPTSISPRRLRVHKVALLRPRLPSLV